MTARLRLPRLAPWLAVLAGCAAAGAWLYAHPWQPLPPPGPGRGLDLGVALAPPDARVPRVHRHDWRVEALRPAEYAVGYGLDPGLAEDITGAHRELARRLRFRNLGPERFSYVPPEGCGRDLACIYRPVARASAEAVRPLGERFRAHVQREHLSPPAAAALVLSFVQRIPYAVPAGEPFGLLPPALVVERWTGDCDSKALLAVLLLREVGVDAVLLASDALAHVAVGVGLPGGGFALRQGGRAWRYLEVTTPGWPVGLAPPRYDREGLWRVLAL